MDICADGLVVVAWVGETSRGVVVVIRGSSGSLYIHLALLLRMRLEVDCSISAGCITIHPLPSSQVSDAQLCLGWFYRMDDVSLYGVYVGVSICR